MPPRLLGYGDLENAYDHPGRIGRLVGLIRALGDGATLVAGAGDDLAAGVLATVADRAAVSRPFFAAASPDLESVGNHDLDEGPEALLSFVERSSARWLCANARRDGERFGADAGVRDATVLEVGGVRVGVFGVAHPDTAALAPAAADLTFQDPVAAAREAVAGLRERGVDRVVGLSHCGDDAPLARAVDADVVLGGHRHERRVDRVDGTLLVRTAGNGTELAEVVLGAAPSVEVHRVHGDAGGAREGPFDEAVAERYRAMRREAGLDEVVARVDEPVERTYDARFGGESRVGNLLADAYRWATGADVGVASGGAIRLGAPLSGEVTVGDLVGVAPFDDDLAVAAVSGRQFRDLLASAEGGGPDGEPWWHLHLSGAAVTWDHAAGDVVAATVGGEPVAADDRYRVAASAFLFEQGGFPPLGAVEPDETFGPQYEHLVAYAREEGVDPSLSGRIVRRNLPD